MEAIAAAEVVVSQPSTAVSESLLLGRPVVLANFQRLAGWETFAASGACLEAADRDALVRAIDALIANEPLRARLQTAGRSFMEDQFFVLDGQAAHRVAAALSAMIEAASVQPSGRP
jgi:hypothetical protein